MKKTDNSIDLKKITGTVIDSLSEEVVFLPSPKHRQIKSKFWTKFESIGLPASSITMSQAIALTNESSLKKLWEVPGFKSWFINEDEGRERLEYLFMLALDAAEHMLLDPDANANAKVNLIKVLATLTNKVPKAEPQFADVNIQRMTKPELEAFIRAKTQLLGPAESDTDSDD